MLLLYKLLTSLSAPFLIALLRRRAKKGKEDTSRITERYGAPSIPRPKGQLVWIHAASVGEAQSTLILINRILQADPDIKFLITSGTVTSANLMAKRLPKSAFHQYYPLDHPHWVESFLNHWEPNIALLMESELWPNMLLALQKKQITTVLINARLSDQSYKRWRIFKFSIKKLLSTFNIIMAQTSRDAQRYEKLGATNVIVTDNLKYSSEPLPYKPNDLHGLQQSIGTRPVWLYASTHDGEEELACRIHKQLERKHPDLLTIIVPRHPERRAEIKQTCKIMGLSTVLRGTKKELPAQNTKIYVADTLGELGLFYHLSDIAMIGRSFSNDGGGGHNPIEAAQLDCAVLTGPRIQFQQKLFNDMIKAKAAIQVNSEDALIKILHTLLGDRVERERLIGKAAQYAEEKKHVINNVMQHLILFLETNKQKAA